MSKELKIVFFGDIVGKPGRRAVAKVVAELRNDWQPDLVVANIENMAHGKGVTAGTISEMAEAGVEAFTSGEHIYDKINDDTARDIFAAYPGLVKPANFQTKRPGRGATVIETPKGKVLLINLIGQVFLHQENISPWEMLPEILSQYNKEELAAIVLDFHAEATSEKVALGKYFDGQLSALFGTHTHVPTADASILAGGTAYITDVGMNGADDSVIGMKKEISWERFLTGKRVAYDVAESSKVRLNYSKLTVDIETKKAVTLEHIHTVVDLE